MNATDDDIATPQCVTTHRMIVQTTTLATRTCEKQPPEETDWQRAEHVMTILAFTISLRVEQDMTILAFAISLRVKQAMTV